MFIANCYNVMIVSPSDVVDERAIIGNCLYNWNDINGEAYNILFRVLDYQKNAHPDSGLHPQDSINIQLLKKADLVIAIFWTKIGSPTQKHVSGSAEEVLNHINNGKKALIYFNDEAVNPSKVDHEQYAKLIEFKNQLKSKCLYWQISSKAELESKLKDHIQQLANELKQNQNLPNSTDKKEIDISDLSDMEIDALKLANNSPEKSLHIIFADNGSLINWKSTDIDIMLLKDAISTLEEKKLLKVIGSSKTGIRAVMTNLGKSFCDRWDTFTII